MNHPESDCDLLVIGGGINGVGIAADAAGRGLKVILCEKGDLAAATSSSSSKLIHGGLRYLEFYEFSLVRKALKERELLASLAPHLIRPLAFQIPQLPHSRSAFLIRAGLFLYDHLARRKRFKSSRWIAYDKESPLNPEIKRGFQYWDAQVDDSRLVILNALRAREKGARILTRTECVEISPADGGWAVSLQDKRSDEVNDVRAKVIVNAAGPWVASLLNAVNEQASSDLAAANPSSSQQAIQLRLVKGSHIIVPRIHSGDEAFMLQHHDGRVVFVIPYLNKYSLIGTTEAEFDGDLDDVKISNEEISYLISIVNLYFKGAILNSDIVHTYAGVRPLIDEEGLDATKVSRDYRLELQTEPSSLLSVFGGKVTTYRVLAEEAVGQLAQFFPDIGEAWTRHEPLPGGNFDVAENLFQEIASKYAWLGPELIARWQSSYGKLVFDILGDARSLGNMGVHFGHNLYQKEVDYLCQQEWAQSAEDVLWRRTKLGYKFTDKEIASLQNYIQQSYTSV